MTASRVDFGNRPVLLSLGAALAGLVAISAPIVALAQQQIGPPVRLGPPSGGATSNPGSAPVAPSDSASPNPGLVQPLRLPGAPPAPLSLTPPAESPALGGPAPTMVAPVGVAPFLPPPPGIEINALRPVTGEALGVTSLPGDPINGDLWRGTPRSLVFTMIDRLPPGIASPTLLALTQRVLSTAAIPPANDGGGFDQSDLLSTRVGKLADLGNPEAVDALLRVIPASASPDLVGRVRVEQHFLAGRTPEACELVKTLFETNRKSPYWQQAQVTCQALTNQIPAAVLGAQLLREQGFEDPAFFTLIEVLGGTRGLQLEKGAILKPQHLMLMRQAKRDATLDMLASASPGVLRALAANNQVALPVRLVAGERAALLGALPAEGYALFVNGLTFPAVDLTNALTIARTDSSARARALLFRAARNQTQPAVRAQMLQAAFDSARAAGTLLPTAALFRSYLTDLRPSEDSAPLTLNAIRGLSLGGDLAAVRFWLQAARAAAPGDKDLALAYALSAPYQRLIASGQPLDSQMWEVWADAARQLTGPDLDRRFGLFPALATALGDRLPPSVWLLGAALPRDAGAPLGSTTALAQAMSAAEGNRIGEAILALASAVGDKPTGLSGAAPMIVQILRRLGLADAARAVALEAAATGGL
jgi:hypothetical protein